MNQAFKYGLSIVLIAALNSTVYAKSNKKKHLTAEVAKKLDDKQTTIEAVIPPEQMKQAVDLYNTSKFQEAYKLFEELSNIKPDDARINFYLGRCATELKLYDEALEAFERVLMAEPEHVRSRMEMARIYFEEQNFDNAEAEFNKALEYPMPKEVKSQIKMFLQAIEDSKKKHFVSGAFILGMGMDNNVANDIGQTTYVPSVLGFPLNGNKPVFDYSMSEILALNHTYKINKDGLSWANSLVLYNQQYREAIGSNVLFMQIGSGPSYKTAKYELSVTPTIENLKYGVTHTDPSYHNGFGRVTSFFSNLFMVDRMVDTMDAVGISEKFSMPLPDKMSMDQSLGYKYQYFKTTAGMDAKVIDLSIGIKKSLDEGRSFGVTLSASRNIQADPAKDRTDVDQNSQGLKLEYSMPVAKYFDLSMNAMIKKVNYEDADASFGVKQQDVQRGFGFSATKMLNQTTILGASFNRVYNTSTLDNKIYQKTTAGVSLTKAF